MQSEVVIAKRFARLDKRLSQVDARLEAIDATMMEIKHENPGLYALLTATREIHGDSMMSYLIYMAIRVMEIRPRIGRLCCLQPEAMIILLDKRAGINARDRHNRTSLHYAIDSGCVATVQLLIRAGDPRHERVAEDRARGEDMDRFQASNRFYAANRELGRVLKTEFVLQYMSEPQLRAKVRRGLLKVEQLHALARAVYYGQRGRISAREVYDQVSACSCLTLILACIV